MIILRFNESFEAFIDAQYPTNISESLYIKASDLMNIYTLHRMKKEEPNFFQMEIKDFSVASFFTGFSSKKFVGAPNYAITVILSESDFKNVELLADFEGMVRRVAFELLTKKNDPKFNELLKSYYIMLSNGDLEPYWGESNEEEVDKVKIIPKEDKKEEIRQIEFSEKIVSEDIEPTLKINHTSPVRISQSEKELEERFDRLEKEVLEQEIKNLKMLLKEKSDKIKEITKQLTDQQSEISKIEEWKQKTEKFKKENEILTTNANNLTELSNQQKEKIDSQEKELNQKKKELDGLNLQINYLKSDMEKYIEQIEESNKMRKEAQDLKKKIDSIKNENENLKKEIEKLSKDNALHIDNITDLKLRLKEFKDKITSEVSLQDNLADAIIDLKKEIKVLRRERDHYQNIVKENKLL